MPIQIELTKELVELRKDVTKREQSITIQLNDP